jgi:predicted RNase H-like nuclease (RuvC/YqgF family)
LFCIKYSNEFQYAIKYNEDVFFSEWNKEIDFRFTALNIELIYNNIVKTITNINESVKDLESEIQKQNEVSKLEGDMKKLESKMHSEKQFNIKVQYNKQITELKRKIEELKNNGE